MEASFVCIWAFDVPAGSEPEFREQYGPNGSWARLFGLEADWLGTELLSDLGRPGRFLTLDRWRSREAYEAFRERHAEAYAEIDRACEQLTIGELLLGNFMGDAPEAAAS